MVKNESYRDGALKMVVKGAGVSFIGMIISNIVLYLLRLILARSLAPNEYGLVFLGFSIFNVLVIFATLGASGAVDRYVPFYRVKKDWERVKGVILSSLYISLPVSVIISTILFVLSDYISLFIFNDPLLSPILRIFSLALPFFAVFKNFYAVLGGFKKIKYAVIIWYISRPILTLSFVLVSLFFGMGILGVSVSYAGAFICVCIISFIIVERKVFSITSRGIKSFSMKKKVMCFSLPLLFSTIMWDLTIKIDTLMIGALKTSFDVGLYQAASPTSQFIFVVPGALSALFMPVITELFSVGKIEDLKKVYKTVSKWIFYVNLPLFLVFFTFPNAIINTLFGMEYILAGNVLRILSFGFLIHSIGFLSIKIVNVYEKTKYHAMNSAVTLITAVILNLILIPLYGIEGAAIATAMVFAIYTSLLVYEVYFLSNALPIHRDFLKSLISGVVSILLIYSATKFLFTSLNIYILVAMFLAFVIIYAFLLLALKGLGKEDIMILKAIEKKTGIRIKFLRNLIKRFI